MDSPAGKLLSAVGGFLLLVGLALVVVITLMLTGLSNMDAQAATCNTPAADNAEFGWPTDKHEVAQGWQDPDENGYSHSGVDFKVDEGSKVYAAADGQVASIANNEVVIRHEQGVETHYKYFHTITAKVGDKVTRGQEIGTSGSGDEETPGLSGQHLHFELRVDQEQNGHPTAVDPGADAFGDTAPEGGGGCGCGAGLGGGNNVQQAFNYLVSNGFTPEQSAGMVGNMIHESAVLPQRLNGTTEDVITTPAQAMGLDKAWGVVQWYPGSKMIGPSRAAGKSDAEIGSLKYQLDFVINQLKGGQPLPEKEAGDAVYAAKTPEDAAFAFAFKFERFSKDPSDPEFNDRRAEAREVFAQFGKSAPAGGPSSGPGSACGQGSGNIAEVAKSLAWPDKDLSKYGTTGSNQGDEKRAKPEFVAAMKAVEEYDMGGEAIFTDCGRFVATVMRFSGADPDYPEVGTDVQRNYLESSGKYQRFGGVPPNGMQPGDILNGPGHTYLYVGPWGEGNSYDSASGSLHGHVPTADHSYSIGGQFTVYRLIKPATAPGSNKVQ
jgi:hypothetical protein